MKLPDIVAVCVASPEQAKSTQAGIDRRIKAGLYPREIRFCVVHDPPAGRVGSGGGTIHALSSLQAEHAVDITRASILLIHAGGESRRLPAYAPEGKLFAPVPVPSSTVLPPVLFDIQLDLYLRYPWRESELIVASGDVYLDFDQASVRDERGSVCGFAAPASFETGSRHGVFVFDRSARSVTDYLQKAPVETLSQRATLPGGQSCALDIGIVAFHGAGRDALVTAVHELGAELATGSRYIDLYTEILTATVGSLDRAGFHDRVAKQSRLSAADRDRVYDLFGELTLQGVLVRRSTFLHFGSLPDVLSTSHSLSDAVRPIYDTADRAGLEPELRPVRTGALLCENALQAEITVAPGGGPVYAEGIEHIRVRCAGENLLIGIHDLDFGEAELPVGFCLDGRQDQSGVVAVYHQDDSFKPAEQPSRLVFCGVLLTQWLTDRNLALSDLTSDREPCDLWALPVFPVEATAKGLLGFVSVEHADASWTTWFKESPRYSLHDLAVTADPQKREQGRAAIRDRLLRAHILSGQGWQSLPATDMPQVFQEADCDALSARVESEHDDLIAVYRRHCLRALSASASIISDTIEVDYLSSLTTPPKLQRSVKPDQIVWARSPVRMDFGGGWTDTPPYTLREGGRVCNVAIDLNGQPPVQVFCRPISEPEIRFHSIDLGSGERIIRFEELEAYRDPTVPFALPRAAMCILGFTRERHPGKTLSSVLTELGGGVEVTLLAAIPKGSGLGTSSILGATLLASLERFFGVFHEAHINTGELYRQVLQMEQMLTTGGGWQDQIGGVAGGVKYAVSEPGLRPELKVYQLDPWLFTAPHLSSRYTLFYTGATRLARNILEDVVDSCNSFDPAYLFTIRRIARLADAAREAFALRNVDAFAQVVRESWRENCLVHPSTTNEEVSDMLSTVAPHYQAMKLLGAGGGGYAFFVSESANQAAELGHQLETWASKRGNTRARVVELSLNTQGLQVTVS